MLNDELLINYCLVLLEVLFLEPEKIRFTTWVGNHSVPVLVRIDMYLETMADIR